MRVVLLGNLNLCEEAAVKFQGSCQVVQGLFKVSVLEVGVSELGVGRDKQK